MDKEKLKIHVKLCRRNLKNIKIKCCASCPFEDEMVAEYPELAEEFTKKRKWLEK